MPRSDQGVGVLVTGSAGFVGSHLCDALASTTGATNALHGLDIAAASRLHRSPTLRVDIRKPEALRRAAASIRSEAVVHLAARAEVVVPFPELGDLLATNVDGTLYVLEAFAPRRFVFASSCAVYGDVRTGLAPTAWAAVNPLGAYGMSKAAGEMICRDWARETGAGAIRLRLGNVVGPRCRGLVPYLVRHAQRHPDGDVPASLRGNGTIMRDYVPVEHVVQVMRASLVSTCAAGASPVYNVGCGRGLTNREVAGIVKRVLAEQGLVLRMDFHTPVAHGEAKRAVLDVRATTRELGLRPPVADAIVDAIERATRDWMGSDALPPKPRAGDPRLQRGRA